MAARAVDPETQRRRGRELWQAHSEWAAAQVAAGVDGPVPPGRKKGSDYNQHVPDLESDGAALDDFFTEATRIMKM